MSEPLPDPHTVLQPSSTTTQPSVLSIPEKKPLSTQEIERMCRAFIRLISAPEEQSPKQKQRSTQHPRTK